VFVPRFLADAADMAAQLRSAESKVISSFRSQPVPHSENIGRLFTEASARIGPGLADHFRDGVARSKSTANLVRRSLVFRCEAAGASKTRWQ
jgi:hypothetical protein